MSFSLILAIFLVGILSTSAFAKDPYGLKPVQSGLGLSIPFTGNTADPADVESREFDLVLKDGATIVKQYGPVALNSSKKGTFAIPAEDLTVGKVYTVELYHTDDTAHATLLSQSSALVTDGHNTFNAAYLDKTGNGLQNANQTGYNNTRKQRSGQKVHGFYENNTNSCASCHQTHTGTDTNLLMKNGTYSTCAACHDGTMGANGVWNPITEGNVSGISGTFSTQEGHNGSIHEADGSLKVSAAPGGNTTAAESNAQWGQEFDCASCHAAHGNGSNEENNLNIDPLGWGSVEYSTTNNDTKNGKLFKGISVQSSVPSSFVTPYIIVKTTATLADVTVVTDKTKYKYQWERAGVKEGDTVLQTYRWNNGKKYVADYSLWLQEKGYPYKADTVLKDSLGADITRAAGMTVVWRDGFAFGPKVADVATANISIGVDVETSGNVQSLYNVAFGDYIPDSGVQMSKYCSACHTDYLSATHSDSTQGYSANTAHRHQTASDTLTCVRCHFGHGSDAQIMKDANDNSYYDLTTVINKENPTTKHIGSGFTSTQAIDYLKDSNPSSALKRYTGMSVCYACHGQGEQFKSNANNNPNAAGVVNGGSLLDGQPGTR